MQQVYLELEPVGMLMFMMTFSGVCLQMIDSSLSEFICVVRDQKKAERITAHLETFLCR